MLIPMELIDPKDGGLKVAVQCVEGLEPSNGKAVFTKAAAQLAAAYGTVYWDNWGIRNAEQSVSSVYAGRVQITEGLDPLEVA